MITEQDTQLYVKTVAHHYDEEASVYDEVYSHPIQKAEDAVLMSLLAPYVTNGQRVLDIGCGTGLPLSYLDITHYAGIDVSAGMIKQAKKDHPGKFFAVSDMHHLPAASGSVDTVISLFGPFSYSQTPEEIVLEIDRVLKPGGSAFIMPYTQRVEHGLDLGGYSTASDMSIHKTFYDRTRIASLFGKFTNVKIIGLNYFGNTLRGFDEAMQANLTQQDYTNLLQLEIDYHHRMPDIKFARHAMVIARKPSVIFSQGRKGL